MGDLDEIRATLKQAREDMGDMAIHLMGYTELAAVLDAQEARIATLERELAGARAKAIDDALEVYQSRGETGLDWDWVGEAADAMAALKDPTDAG